MEEMKKKPEFVEAGLALANRVNVTFALGKGSAQPPFIRCVV